MSGYHELELDAARELIEQDLIDHDDRDARWLEEHDRKLEHGGMIEAYGTLDPKHPEYHDAAAALWDNRDRGGPER